DGIRDFHVTGVQTCALPICCRPTACTSCSSARWCRRPIAWVSSVDAAGVRNLAPFSYFMAITDDPPTIAFSSSFRGAGTDGKKDTLRNVEATREFVVNVVDDALAARVNLTSGEYPPEVDEFELAGLAVAPATRVE